MSSVPERPSLRPLTEKAQRGFPSSPTRWTTRLGFRGSDGRSRRLGIGGFDGDKGQ